MDLTVKMNCGKGTIEENGYLLIHLIETGVLNSQKEYNLQIMPGLERYNLTVEKNMFDKIKENKDLYYAYQANIAMAFKDEYHRVKKKKGESLNSTDIHFIANNAAKYFLDLLLKDTVETTHNSEYSQLKQENKLCQK